jgi:hypothetical protein
MTQGEFAKGWKLLILQPWGWRYRSLDAHGKPTEEAMTQMEFYFAKLKWAHPEAWWQVADRFAQGGEWPSVDELRNSLRQVNGRYVKSLTGPRTGYDGGMPAEVRAMVERIGQ